MATTKEVGFIPNVKNLKAVINEVKLMTKYNPINSRISIASLEALLAKVIQNQKDFSVAETKFNSAVDARETAFLGIKVLGTQIFNGFLVAVDDDPVAGSTLEGKVKTLKGIRITPKKEIEKLPELGAQVVEEEALTISQIQQGFDDIVEHLVKIIAFLKNYPKYQPNEPEIQIATLEALAADLVVLNDKAGDATTEYKQARRKRSRLHLAPKDSVHELMQLTKKYVLSTYKANSAEYASIKGLRFKTPRREEKKLFMS